jgi:hypothetical protein
MDLWYYSSNLLCRNEVVRARARAGHLAGYGYGLSKREELGGVGKKVG